jgi:hypothetical protein
MCNENTAFSLWKKKCAKMLYFPVVKYLNADGAWWALVGFEFLVHELVI